MIHWGMNWKKEMDVDWYKWEGWGGEMAGCHRKLVTLSANLKIRQSCTGRTLETRLKRFVAIKYLNLECEAKDLWLHPRFSEINALLRT